MKLTNKQLDIIVGELYDRISKPIIKENNEALDNYKVPKNQYLKDVERYKKLRDEIDALYTKYRGKTVNGYTFSNYGNPMEQDGSYKRQIAKDNVKLKDYPSKTDLERKVVLSGNADLSELIESITKEYNGQI